MIVRLLGVLLLLAGCRQILGFEDPSVVDSSIDVSLPDSAVCTELGVTCADELTLRACGAVGELPVETTCSWGCLAMGPSRCGDLEPTGGQITTTDLAPDDTLLDHEISGSVVIDGDTGQITNVRPNGMGVINGISWERRGALSVFRFKSVAFKGPIAVRGGNPVVIVADGVISIEDIVDARGTCNSNGAGPGGSSGGNSGADGNGTGRGRRGNAGPGDSSGGGGAGFGAIGGVGGEANGVNGGLAGSSFGAPTITDLVGGSGGGSGAKAGEGGVGGGGGGALYLASNTEVRIIATGGINAGGCGGRRGTGQDGSGGGGGSGGAILIEAPVVSILGGLAVNGGGGGSGIDGTDGQSGQLTPVAALGGASSLSGDGGPGGAGSIFAGTPGGADSPAGGGGGAVGRIRINTRTGTVQLTGFASPMLDVPGSSSTTGTATVK